MLTDFRGLWKYEREFTHDLNAVCTRRMSVQLASRVGGTRHDEDEGGHDRLADWLSSGIAEG